MSFLRAVAGVDRFAGRLPSKERMFPYVEILDELARIGKGYDFETMGVDPVKDLGASLTNDAAKWVRLDADPPSFLETFLTWATNDTRTTVAGDSALYVAEAATPERLLAWNRGTLAALACLKLLKVDRAVIEAFEELQGVAVREILTRRREFAPALLAQAIKDTRSTPGIEELLALLDQETASAAEPADRARLLEWAVRLSENGRGLGPAAPLRLSAGAGAVVLEALGRALSRGDAPDPTLVAGAWTALTPSQRNELLGLLVDLYADRPIPRAQIDFLWPLSERIADDLPADVSERRREFRKLSLRLAALRFAGDRVLEGSYRVRVDGEERTLVIAELGGGDYALDFGSPAPGRDVAAWNVAFRWRGGRFHADRSETDGVHPLPADRWPQLLIDPSRDDNPVAGALFDRVELHSFSGERRSRFPVFESTGAAMVDLDSWAGLYKGKLGDEDASLAVTSLGASLAAGFSRASSTTTISLDEGRYDRARGAVFLTGAASRGDASWVQVRGRFSADGRTFAGYYLVGSTGEVQPLKLRKAGDVR